MSLQNIFHNVTFIVAIYHFKKSLKKVLTIFKKYGKIIDVRESGQQDIDKEIRKTTINQHKQGVKNQNSEN